MKLLYLILIPLASSFTTPSPARFTTSLSASRSSLKQSSRDKWYSSRSPPSTPSPPCTVVGTGRIGSLLSSPTTTTVSRTTDMSSLPPGPIYVATRNDSLDDVISRCPDDRKSDLVFLQNGFVQPYLDSRGLGGNTQALLYFAVTAVGADPIDGVTAVSPEGLTGVTGTHGEDLKRRLAGVGLKCNVLDKEDYERAMWEKLMWISTLMLVGSAKGCDSVGQAQQEHRELVETVINELVEKVGQKMGVKFEDGTVDRLTAYTDVVSNFPCAVKEYEWRNKVFYEMGCTVHNGLLEECKEKGVFQFPED